jgi:type II secretory pathway pseudopilin PulG
MKDKINYKKGYTLLFSIIVASVVLSIAAFILSVSRKQFILASVSRDSTIAIYAADSAIQCALESYYRADLSTSTLVNGNFVPKDATVNCNNETVSSPYINAPQNENFDIYNLKNDATFRVEETDPNQPLAFYNSNDSCAFINVIQGYDATNGGHKTIIEARGYSNNYSPPCAPNSPYNPRNVERAIRLIYND